MLVNRAESQPSAARRVGRHGGLSVRGEDSSDTPVHCHAEAWPCQDWL